MPELRCWKQDEHSLFSSVYLVQFPRSEIEIENFINPGLAWSGFEKRGPGEAGGEGQG